jgi:MFS transporter, PAT family, beta-lactamase induction signal transducer AmpG
MLVLEMISSGMKSGWLQELIGCQLFFRWVMPATIPSFLFVPFVPLDRVFGKKTR